MIWSLEECVRVDAGVDRQKLRSVFMTVFLFMAAACKALGNLKGRK